MTEFEYPFPPGWSADLAAGDPANDPDDIGVGTEPPGSAHGEAPGAAHGGRGGKETSPRRLRCVAMNKTGTTRAVAGQRCAQTAFVGDPDHLCWHHRKQFNDGQTVRTVDAWVGGKMVRGKVLEPPERVPRSEVEISPSKPGTGNLKPLRLSLGPEDIKRLNTAEGRQDLEQTAVAYVASLLLDEYAPHRERLQAARMVLPPRMLTAEEMQEERDLDTELFALMDEVVQEAEAERPSDADVIQLLSPETRTRVLKEVADHGIRWVDESEAS